MEELISITKGPLFLIFEFSAKYDNFSNKYGIICCKKYSLWLLGHKSKSSSMQQNEAFSDRYELFHEWTIHTWDKSDRWVSRWSDQKLGTLKKELALAS